MRREQFRLKWEEEEQKLSERTDIHYEDIRFDGKYKQIKCYLYILPFKFCVEILHENVISIQFKITN